MIQHFQNTRRHTFEKLNSKLHSVFSRQEHVHSAETTSGSTKWCVINGTNGKTNILGLGILSLHLLWIPVGKVSCREGLESSTISWTSQHRTRAAQMLLWGPGWRFLTFFCLLWAQLTRNSFHVYVIQVRHYHLPLNPKDKELNAALGHVSEPSKVQEFAWH